MLRVSQVWTNATEADKSFALWFVGVDQNGSWWWLNVAVSGKGLGLSGVHVRRVAEPADVRRAMEEDDLGSPPWSPIDPERAIELVDAELVRARAAPWAVEYPDHFRKVESEYERFREVLGG